jgi:hypothetical protein
MFDSSMGNKGASQETTDVSGTGRLVRGSQYVESGALALGKGASYKESGSLSLDKAKNATFGGLNLAGVKVEKGGSLTVQTGVQPDLLQDLVGNVSKASSDQLSAFSKESSQQISKLTDMVSQKADTEAGSPNRMTWLAGAALAVLALFLVFKK